MHPHTLRASGAGPSARARNIREKASKARVAGLSENQASGAVDFPYLTEYAAGDETLVREVLAVFCAEAAEWSDKLCAGADGWRTVVHTLKGTARTIGAYRLGELCETAETQGTAALPQLCEELETVVAEISRYLAARAG
jgi:HPt (histidine-containing phosphotransfer) domain-containing protein